MPKLWKTLSIAIALCWAASYNAMAALHIFEQDIAQCPPGAVGTSDTAETSWVPSNNLGWLYQLYSDILNRAPDTSGKNYWLAAANGGTPRVQIVDAFLKSPEYANKTVAALYQKLLGRAPELPGSLGWVTAMENGQDWTFVENGICSSPEYKRDQQHKQVTIISDAISSTTASSISYMYSDVLYGNGSTIQVSETVYAGGAKATLTMDVGPSFFDQGIHMIVSPSECDSELGQKHCNVLPSCEVTYKPVTPHPVFYVLAPEHGFLCNITPEN